MVVAARGVIVEASVAEPLPAARGTRTVAVADLPFFGFFAPTWRARYLASPFEGLPDFVFGQASSTFPPRRGGFLALASATGRSSSAKIETAAATANLSDGRAGLLKMVIGP